MNTLNSEKNVEQWQQMALPDLLARAVAESGKREAVIDPANRAQLCPGEARRLTFTELDDAAARLAAVLQSEGVGGGDIVLVQLPNVWELVATYLAVAKLGAVISPVPMQYRRHELRDIVAATRPKLAITVDRFKEEYPAAEHAAVLPEGTPLYSLGGDGERDLSAALAGATSHPGGDVSPQDLYTLCWTSGTTGTPKGVPRRHAHWLAMMPVFEDSVRLQRHAHLLCPFPMVNMAALAVFLFQWLSLQGKLVLHHPLDLPVFLQQIREEDIHFTVAPPALLNMLLAKEELLQGLEHSGLVTIGSGSAPLSPWMIKGFHERFGIDVINMFGSNEGVCLVSDALDVPDPEDRAVFFPRFGRPEFEWRNRMGRHLLTKLVDIDSGNEITAPGEPGELLIRGPTVFDGYFGDAVDNARVFDQEGYFRTGDLFEIAGARDQFYRFVGRCKDIIVRGGMKVSPEELDRLLLAHPDVADVATVGYPDQRLGEKVGAVVVPAPDKSVTLESLCEFLQEQGVARFKHPEQLVIRAELPRNPLGKVMRHELKDLFS